MAELALLAIALAYIAGMGAVTWWQVRREDRPRFPIPPEQEQTND